MHEYPSDRVAGDVRRTVPVLLKIHGNVDNIEDIVLTRTDYTSLRVNGTQALRVLEALLLTRTALLLGYSLRDPDTVAHPSPHTGAVRQLCCRSSAPEHVDARDAGFRGRHEGPKHSSVQMRADLGVSEPQRPAVRHEPRCCDAVNRSSAAVQFDGSGARRPLYRHRRRPWPVLFIAGRPRPRSTAPAGGNPTELARPAEGLSFWR